MATVEIPIGEFLPSQPETQNPGCVIADGVIPAEGGYAPFRGPVTRAPAISGRVRGAEMFFRADGSPFVVGGTEEQLFARAGGAVTYTDGMTPLPVDLGWDFAQFNNFIIATSPGNAPRYIPDYTVGATFEALPGSPPQARYCARFADFLMLGNIDGAQNRLQWSAYNSPGGSWDPFAADARQTQTGFNDLDPRFGAITALSGGRYPMVFQERAVWLMQYVGPPQVWSLGLASEDRGCIAPFSCVTVGGQTYFLAQDGFWVTNGSEFQPIGSQKVNRWFFDEADNANLSLTQGTVDWKNKSIVWAFRSRFSGGDGFDKCLIYSWDQNRFSTVTIDADWLVGSRVTGTTLEQLDGMFSTLEDVTPNLDAPEWRAGDRVLAAFMRQDGGASNYRTFDGQNVEAIWETGFFQPRPGRRAFVTSAQGVFDAADWQMEFAPITMNNQRVETYGEFRGAGVDGSAPLRADGKEMRMAIRMPRGADWGRAVAMQLTFRESGGR